MSAFGLFLLGKLARSFRAWKSFTRKSVQDKILKHKAENHYNTALKRNAVLTWKSFIHLRFRIKVIYPFFTSSSIRLTKSIFFTILLKSNLLLIELRKQKRVRTLRQKSEHCLFPLELLRKHLFKASAYKHMEMNICISFLAILARVLVCLKCLSMFFPIDSSKTERVAS